MFGGLPFGDLLGTLLPDFVLGFTFFTALCYGVLGKRLEHQRSAAAMSASLGLALTVGLVWWEYANGWSIRNLGSVAVGFALFALAGVIFQSTRQIGGSWSGAAIALCAAYLVGTALGVPWPVEGLLSVVVVLLLILAAVGGVLFHRRGSVNLPTPQGPRIESPAVAGNLHELLRDLRGSEQIGSQFEHLRNAANWLGRSGDVDKQIRTQLHRVLPEEGWLTRQMARLRGKAQLIRAGHLRRIKELDKYINALPADARKTAVRQAKDLYREVEMDRRIERLDKAVAAAEKRIIEVTQKTYRALEGHNYRVVPSLLDRAGTLQKHNTKLIRIIIRTEERLLAMSRKALLESGR